MFSMQLYKILMEKVIDATLEPRREVMSSWCSAGASGGTVIFVQRPLFVERANYKLHSFTSFWIFFDFWKYWILEERKKEFGEKLGTFTDDYASNFIVHDAVNHLYSPYAKKKVDISDLSCEYLNFLCKTRYHGQIQKNYSLAEITLVPKKAPPPKKKALQTPSTREGRHHRLIALYHIKCTYKALNFIPSLEQVKQKCLQVTAYWFSFRLEQLESPKSDISLEFCGLLATFNLSPAAVLRGHILLESSGTDAINDSVMIQVMSWLKFSAFFLPKLRLPNFECFFFLKVNGRMANSQMFEFHRKRYIPTNLLTQCGKHYIKKVQEYNIVCSAQIMSSHF